MIRTILRGIGHTVLTLGLIVMLFAAYQVYGKAWQVARERDRLESELTQQWEDGEESFNVARGEPLAKVSVPAMDKEWIIVEGVGVEELKLAPGHYPDTQYPGQEGNFALAAHRSPALFWDVDKLASGHRIVVETAQYIYTYTVYNSRVVKPTDTWVIGPDPDEPGALTSARTVLTLTTCHPKWDNYQRFVVHAELDEQEKK